MAYKVILDAGHGGYDNGATYNGRREKDDTLRLALEVGKILKDAGVDVGYTRTSDVYQSPTERAEIANQEGADLFISLHRGSSDNPNTYSGVESFIYDDGGLKEEIAEHINERLSDLGFHNFGVSIRPNLAVLRKTKMPAVMVEAGFINTDRDNALFDSRFEEIADAIAEGILEGIAEEKKPVEYRVQVGLYRSFANAQNRLNTLVEQGYDGEIVPFKDLYAVQLGNFDSLDDAIQFERELRNNGLDTLVVKVS